MQEQYAGMRLVLRAAQQLQQAGLLNPDSDPAAYFDSIRQWALWSSIDGLDLGSFTDAWVAHTREAAEATGFAWSDQAADMLRAAAPSRWTDIQRILETVQ